MQIVCLGGAAAWPNPGQGCSSYLVRDGTTSLLLDCGSNTLQEYRKHASLQEIDGIVISHPHSDHVLDLVAYRYALVYAHAEATGDSSNAPIPIWLPPGGISRIRALGEALSGQGEAGSTFWEPVFELCEYDPLQHLTIGTVEVRFHETQHFTPCYAMRLSGSGEADLLYGADTGSIDLLIDFSAGAGLLIAEATMRDEWAGNPDEQGHISPADAGHWAAAAGVDSLVLTHLWCERPDSEVLRLAANEYSGPIAIAKPGATFGV